MPVPSIGLIAPTEEIARRACGIARDLGILELLAPRVANLEEGLDTARTLEAEGVEVLIARSGTAELIGKGVPTPVVQIPITPQDMARALREAKELTGLERPRIALFAIRPFHEDLRLIAELMGLDLKIYCIDGTEEDLKRQVERAVAGGSHVLVAGSVGVIMAAERHFPSLMLDSGSMALRSALMEANRVAYARKLEKTLAERFRTVVETSRDGILVLDLSGRVQIANPAAARILGLAFDPVGRHLDEVLPMPGLEGCLRAGEVTEDALVNMASSSIIVNMEPTMINDEVHGAVVSFQPAQSITELESKIRNSLYTKGFVADYVFEDILGVSERIREAVRVARNFADSPCTVLLSGETGTGKELFAHAIHAASRCAHGPFVAVNCSALPAALLESELFGYAEGAFTGANRKGKPGLFELAHKGTLFLDEISEMNRFAQLRLLRVLQERRTMRLGGDRYIPVEVRIIAATNRNLLEMVQAGKYRQDLFYRLNVLALPIPPLRQREGDVPLLAEFFLRKSSARYGRVPELTEPVLRRLSEYAWPGNVRELQNVMERLALVKGGRTVRPDDLAAMLVPAMDAAPKWPAPAVAPVASPAPSPGAPPAFSPGPAIPAVPSPPSPPAISATLADTAAGAERERIVRALCACGGHQGRAAAQLGMNRSTLYRKMRRHGIRKQPV